MTGGNKMVPVIYVKLTRPVSNKFFKTDALGCAFMSKL